MKDDYDDILDGGDGGSCDTTSEAAAKVARMMARPRDPRCRPRRPACPAARGFKCPKCGCINFDRVLETRSGDDHKTRRRECRCCGRRFTTMEVPVS